jgi:hypothetical protein
MTTVYQSAASKIICLSGDQKLGKSCGVVDTEWPKDWKVFVHDIDGGFEYAKKLWLSRGHSPANLSLAPGDTHVEVHKSLWDPPPGHDLYVIDTYTTAMKRFKSYVQKNAAKTGEMLDITDWKKVGGKISGLALDYFERWLQQVGKEGAWGLIICQERHEDVKGQPLTRAVPDLVGQARRDVAATANFVFHLEMKLDNKGGQRMWRRVLRTQGTPTVMAADRSGFLEPEEPYDLAGIIKKVEAGRQAEAAKNAPEVEV